MFVFSFFFDPSFFLHRLVDEFKKKTKSNEDFLALFDSRVQ